MPEEVLRTVFISREGAYHETFASRCHLKVAQVRHHGEDMIQTQGSRYDWKWIAVYTK